MVWVDRCGVEKSGTSDHRRPISARCPPDISLPKPCATQMSSSTINRGRHVALLLADLDLTIFSSQAKRHLLAAAFARL